MSSVHRVRPREITNDEILDRLKSGHRVIIEREVLGGTHEVTLRFDGKQYYCDTPTTLHRYDSIDGMRECLNRLQYGNQ